MWQFPKIVCCSHGYMSIWVLLIWQLFKQKKSLSMVMFTWDGYKQMRT
jgi:hypothetical protein